MNESKTAAWLTCAAACVTAFMTTVLVVYFCCYLPNRLDEVKAEIQQQFHQPHPWRALFRQ